MEKKGCKVLDVGCGSGIVCSYLAHIIDGKVFGIDHMEELVKLSEKNISTDPASREFLKSGKIKLLCCDGFEGLPNEGPFDVIHIGAAAPEIPKKLFQQLSIGGRMVLPIGDYSKKNH